MCKNYWRQAGNQILEKLFVKNELLPEDLEEELFHAVSG